MGKYMKKGKITADISVMEVSQHTAILGVRTRAKTLALQPNPELFCLQLRSRRLEKPQFQTPSLPKQSSYNKQSNTHKTSSRLRVDSGSFGSVSFSCSKKGEGFVDFNPGLKRASVGKDYERESEVIAEASFGENSLEIDGTERSTRESTPCSYVRGSDTIGTPGSAVGPSCSAVAGRRARTSIQRIIPSAYEMEEFFAAAELLQQEQFLMKYNFDIVNDSPLSGRFEWVRLIP